MAAFPRTRLRCASPPTCALVAMAALAGCGGHSRQASAVSTATSAETVAVVNGRAITASQVKLQAESSGASPRAALDALVDEELLVAEAERRGIGGDPDVQAAMAAELVRKGLAATFERDVTPAAVTEDEIRTAYARNAGELDRPEIRVVAHVLVPYGAQPPDPARKQALRARADQVAARAQAARTLDEFKAIGPALSDATATLLVEELATGPSGYTVKAFADAAFALAHPGDRSGVVETKFGLHVIWLERIQPPYHVPIEQVREKLRDGVWPEVRRREFARFIDRLVEQHHVELHAERLEQEPAQ